MAIAAPNRVACLSSQFISLTMGVIMQGKHKHYVLDEARSKRAQKLFGAQASAAA
jgi:hypothetical protein